MKIIRKTIKNILFFLAPSVTDWSWSVLSAIRFHHLSTNFLQKWSKIIFNKKYCGSFINNRNSYQWLLALGILYKVFFILQQDRYREHCPRARQRHQSPKIENSILGFYSIDSWVYNLFSSLFSVSCQIAWSQNSNRSRNVRP